MAPTIQPARGRRVLLEAADLIAGRMSSTESGLPCMSNDTASGTVTRG
jgi:hypothetical protein